MSARRVSNPTPSRRRRTTRVRSCHLGAVIAGTLVVLLVGAVVDTWTGLDHVAQLLRAVRGVE